MDDCYKKTTSAVQIALETLTQRCKQFERRVHEVEAENMKLKSVCSKFEDNKQDSLNELDTLRHRNSQLIEHNTQLKNNIQMVASENRQLWAKLTKLLEVNQTLGNKLNKINNSLMQHSAIDNSKLAESTHSQLTRSKTFTQNEPYLKYQQMPQQQDILIENAKISLELEDISLKLISNLAREKCELEAQCNEMLEMQTEMDVGNSLGFSYPGEDLEESIVDNLDKHINDMKVMKNLLDNERRDLIETIDTLKKASTKCKMCEERRASNVSIKLQEKDNVVKDVPKEIGTTPKNVSSPNNVDHEKLICPICSKVFIGQAQFKALEEHVELHFIRQECGDEYTVI